ncbi:MAG: hypothetical protein ACK5X3_03220 [Pseudomonadota bacterium]
MHYNKSHENDSHSAKSYSQPVGTVPSLAGFTVRELHCLANEVARLAAGLVVGQQLDQAA